MKKIILGLLLATTISGAALAATAPVAAAPMATTKSGVDFEALSKAEKIKLIEQKHAASKIKADAKWKAMSDDEKIAKYEHRRQAFMARRNGAAGAPVAGQVPVAAAATAPAVKSATAPVKQ